MSLLYDRDPAQRARLRGGKTRGGGYIKPASKSHDGVEMPRVRPHEQNRKTRTG